MAGFNPNQSGGSHGGQLGALGAQNRSRTPVNASLPPEEQPDANGVTRAGRGYDATTTQLANPNAPLSKDPQWNANAGPYGQYLNRLDTNGQAHETILQHNARQAANAALGQGPQQNQALQTANANQADARQAQLGALPALTTAGMQNAASQRALLAGGQANGAADSATQRTMSAMAPLSDLNSAAAQNQALGMFADAAAGRGPSAAQAVLRQATANNVATQRALAAGARGGGAAAAMRQANQAGVQLGLQSQAQAAALRAQEQQAGMSGLAGASAQARAADQARYGLGADILASKRAADTASAGTLGQLAGQARGQDIGQAGMTADYLSGIRGQDIGAGSALGGVENQQNAINNAQALGAIGAANDLERTRQSGIAGANQTNLDAAGLMSGNYTQNRNITLQHDANQDSLGAQYLGAGLNGLGAAAQGIAPLL